MFIFDAMETQEVLCGVIGTPTEYNLRLVVLLLSNQNRVVLSSVHYKRSN